MKKIIFIPISEESGRPVGQYNHRAKLTDTEVEIIRTLHEEERRSYNWLADNFGVSKSTIQDICTYRRRNTTATAWKKITVETSVANRLTSYTEEDDG